MATTVGKLHDYRVADRLPDGREVVVRAVTSEDKCLLQEVMHHLSKESRYFRFFIFKDSLSEKELEYFTNIDFVKHVAIIVGFLGDDRFQPVGTARYILSTDPQTPTSAEFAVTVEEEYQHMGFGSLLLRHLCCIAKANGVTELTGLVLPSNAKMLHLLEHFCLPCQGSLNSAGEWEVKLKLDKYPCPAAQVRDGRL